MAFMVDQQPNFKHFCRICKKGFMCGRALGGHMRAHGIGDESANMEDEDQTSDWEERENVPPVSKRMYGLRTNPNRLKSCRNCENCGMEFSSWKSFFEHGKCSSGDDAEEESLVSSPESDSGAGGGGGRRGCGWSKRKRTFRANMGNSSEEEDIAAKCLMLLRSATVDCSVVEPEESCASASKEEEHRRNPVAAVFVQPLASRAPLDKAKGVAKGMFECKACKKVFNSHQALGGHRASHKKVKGCFAARLDQNDDQDIIAHEEEFFIPSKSNFQINHGHNFSKRKSKVHECSICHRIFSSGQALGGHKRCHWITSNSPEASSLAKFHHFHDQMDQVHQRPKFISQSDTLDLNLPAPSDDMTVIRRDPKNPLSFEVCTEINLQSWIDVDEEGKDDHNYHHHHDDHDQNNDDDVDNKINKNNSCLIENVEDEADSKVKLAKLSELKDINMSGVSSPWLQVGIGSTTDVAADT